MNANVYAGFRAAYRTWLEILGSDGGLTVPNPFRPGPLETLELERDGVIEHIDVAGSPEIFVREIEDFEACVLDGAAARRHPGRKPPAQPAALYACLARPPSRVALRGRPRSPPGEGVVSSIDGSGRFDGAVAAVPAPHAAKGDRSHAIILPGGPPFTLAFFATTPWIGSRTTTRWSSHCFALTRSSDRCSPRTGRKTELLTVRYAAPHRRREGRQRHRRWRRAGRRAVDDDDRYGGCGIDGAAVHRVVAGRIGNGAGHRQPSGGRGGGARDQAPHARRRLHRAAHRRLPLQRPPAADAFPGVRSGARQIPYQSRQRRHRQAARRTVRDHLPGGYRPRQAGAHRRQRRLPQPGAGDGEDAGEHRSQPRQGIRRHHQRVHGAVGDPVDRARHRDGAAQGPDHHLVQGVEAATPDRGLPRARQADRSAAPSRA